MARNHLTSSSAACCWIPLFALRCEAARRPELGSRASALVAPDGTRRVWQVSPLARHAGVKPAMTVSQAIGLCHTLLVCEADPIYYDEQFARLLSALGAVSPVVEAPELGRVFVGTDGLEGLYGTPEQIVEAIQMRSAECGMRNVSEGSFAARNTHLHSAFRIPHSALRVGWGRGKFVAWVAASQAKPGGAVIVRFTCGVRRAACGMRNVRGGSVAARNTPLHSAFRIPHSALRVGWGRGKFVAWVAASQAKPGGAVIVRPGEEGRFLAAQPLAVLPLDPDTHRRLRLLGLRTIGDLAALPEEAVVSQFGRAGRRLWRLAAGETAERGVGREGPPPRTAAPAPFSSASRGGA